MKIVLAVIGALILVAAGIYFDVLWCIVGGIEEIVRGFQAHPSSGHDIGFGVLRLIISGVGIFVGVLLGGLLVAVASDQ